MMQPTLEQRDFVVTIYFKTKKFTEVKILFIEQLFGHLPPNKRKIWKNVKK